MSLLGIIVYIPSLILDLFLTAVTSWSWYNRIDEFVVLGGLPFKYITKQLLSKENVKAVVSMNEDFELYIASGKEEWEKEDVQYLQLPTSDILQTLSQTNLKEGVDFICQHIEKSVKDKSGSRVYVHCKSGKTRSPTLVGCYLMQKHGWTPEEAVRYLKTRRGQIMLHTKQWEALRVFHQNLTG